MSLGKVGRQERRESITGEVIPDVPSAPEAAKAVKLGEPGPRMDKIGANGVLPEHEFDLDFTDHRGRVWQGRFKCHALTVRERIQVGLVRSRLSGGIAPHALDVFTSDLLEILAHLAVALDDAPAWAKGGQLEQLLATEVVQAIYEEVANFENRFHSAGSRRSSQDVDSGSDVSDGLAVASQDG